MAHLLVHIRLESKKPQQVPIDSEIHFGASTRIYMIRERPQPVSNLGGSEEMEKRNDDIEGGLLGLPESETELDVSELISYTYCTYYSNITFYVNRSYSNRYGLINFHFICTEHWTKKTEKSEPFFFLLLLQILMKLMG